MEELRELLQFLEPSARLDLKTVALQHILGLTGSPEGLELISNVPELVRMLENIGLPFCTVNPNVHWTNVLLPLSYLSLNLFSLIASLV